MRARHADRLWAIGGALGAVVLLAAAWFLLIGPQRSETAALRGTSSCWRSIVRGCVRWAFRSRRLDQRASRVQSM